MLALDAVVVQSTVHWSGSVLKCLNFANLPVPIGHDVPRTAQTSVDTRVCRAGVKIGCPCLCRSIPEGFEGVSEGKATVLSQGNSVFYNRAQVVNRDISIAVLRWFIQQQGDGKSTKKKRSRAARNGGAKPVAPAPIKVSVASLTPPCALIC